MNAHGEKMRVTHVAGSRDFRQGSIAVSLPHKDSRFETNRRCTQGRGYGAESFLFWPNHGLSGSNPTWSCGKVVISAHHRSTHMNSLNQ